MNKKNVFLALAMATIFGLGWIVGKSALEQLPPIQMAALRFGLAAALILPFTGCPHRIVSDILTGAAIAPRTCWDYSRGFGSSIGSRTTSNKWELTLGRHGCFQYFRMGIWATLDT